MSIRLDSEKKTVLTVLALMVVGILLIAGSAFAAGDLHVMGKLGVGTDTPNKELDVRGTASVITTNIKRSFTVYSSLTEPDATLYNFIIGTTYNAVLRDTGNGSVTGLSAVSTLMTNAPTAQQLVGASFTSQVGTNNNVDPLAETDVTSVTGFQYTFNRRYNNNRIYNIANSYGARFKINSLESYISTPVNVTNHYHQFLDDPGLGKLSMVNITNLAGIWIKKQTAATNNYGIVLAGDGAGSDIVFGPNQETRIYSQSGELFAKDGAGNVTQLSPHDPETGEWIYYSKNVKTGKVVRVNMEELVRDIEKLTGKTYMVETFEEIK